VKSELVVCVGWRSICVERIECMKTFFFHILAHGKIDKKGNYCGSSGCAMGEFPVLWPKEWRWERFSTAISDFEVLHKSQVDLNEQTKYSVMADFFSITEAQIKHLFLPYKQNRKYFGGRRLDDNATADEVADNIIAFIKKVAS